MGIIVVSGGISKALFTDNFNRANGALGSNWTNTNGSGIAIASNIVALSGSTDGRYPSRWIGGTGVVNTNNQYVEITLASAPSAVGSGMFLRANTGMTQMVIATFTSSTSEIGTATSGAMGSYTVRQGSGATYANGDVAHLECTGNVYTLLRNGSANISWTDSGSLVSIGTSNRSGGVYVQRATFTNSGSLDNFVFGDL